MNKKILLIIVLVLVVGSIVYLELQKTDAGDVTATDISLGQQETAQGGVGNETPAIPRRVLDKQELYDPAVELVEPDGWINTEPFNLSDHIGKKVILVDFWTYSCINCQRTIPHLRSWWESYEDDGLLIVGIHTPEFAFEKDRKNVVQATEKFGVTWPVLQDNDKQTWRAYQNRYWPRKYLIDIDGFIVYDHIGEGSYEETEAKIVELLEERKQVLGLDEEIEAEGSVEMEDPDFEAIRTPEIYFGYGRYPEHLGNVDRIIPDSSREYALPAEREPNKFYLDGTWRIEEEAAISESKGSITIDYTSKIINIVAGPTEDIGPAAVEPPYIIVYVDGEQTKEIPVYDHGLYELDAADEYGSRTIRLEVDPFIEAYTLTFG